MLNVLKAMQPKSEQLNAEDLLLGPRTIRIRDVVEFKGEKGEAKLKVFFDGDEGKPWVMSKTAVRVLASCWGEDGKKWIGLSCTLYNDPEVVYGGQKVGGIRVSHIEGLSAPRTLMLTVTRGKRKEHVIQPLRVAKGGAKAQAFRDRLFAVANDPEKSVQDAWALVSDEMRAELGAGLLEQLLEIERAAAAHATSDDAVLDDLNAQLAAE
jgi:hypothetical protein